MTENKIKSKEKYNKIKQKLVGVGVESSINQRGTIQNTLKNSQDDLIRQQGNTRCIKTALVTNVASEPQFKKCVSRRS